MREGLPGEICGYTGDVARLIDLPTGEHRLWFAVLVQALADELKKRSRKKLSRREYLDILGNRWFLERSALYKWILSVISDHPDQLHDQIQNFLNREDVADSKKLEALEWWLT